METSTYSYPEAVACHILRDPDSLDVRRLQKPLKASDYYEVGLRYMRDTDFKVLQHGFDLMTMAAERGYGEAHIVIGNLFRDGAHGHGRNIGQAITYYELAINCGAEQQAHDALRDLAATLEQSIDDVAGLKSIFDVHGDSTQHLARIQALFKDPDHAAPTLQTGSAPL